jgi:hypothetical protein
MSEELGDLSQEVHESQGAASTPGRSEGPSKGRRLISPPRLPDERP